MISQMQIAVALLLALGGTAFASTDGWKLFDSPFGLSVSYPGNWFDIGASLDNLIGASVDRLYIRSAKDGAEGIGIKQGQADITVREADASSYQTLAQIIAYYTQDTTVLSRRNIPVEASGGGCELQEIISKE